MLFCSSCGKENADSSKYCVSCGQMMLQNGSNHSMLYGQPSSAYMQSNFTPSPHLYGEVPTRTYWYYSSTLLVGLGIIIAFFASYFNLNFVILRTIGQFLGLSIFLSFVGTIVMLVYFYRNGDDYRNMVYKYHPHSYPNPQDPYLLLILAIIFLPLSVYFKYQQLYDHFNREHPELQNPSTPPLAPLIMSFGPAFFIYFIGFSVIGISNFIWLYFVPVLGLFGFIYFENRWQETLNLHIKYHQNPQYRG